MVKGIEVVGLMFQPDGDKGVAAVLIIETDAPQIVLFSPWYLAFMEFTLTVNPNSLGESVAG